MANRKELKKYVNNVAGSLFADCLATKLYVKDVNPILADEILERILKFREEFICRISHTEPGNVKGFYRKFREDFGAETRDIVDAIDGLA